MTVLARLKALERSTLLAQARIIPVEDRWWCELCDTPAERAKCLAEPVTWADLEADWSQALTELLEMHPKDPQQPG